MTSTATKPAPKLAGKALYLELVADPTLTEDEQRKRLGWQHKGTKQVIVFPEYQDDTGRIYPARVLTRLVSEYSPRAQWEWNHIERLNPEVAETGSSYYADYYTYPNYSNEEWDELPQRSKDESKALSLRLTLAREMAVTYWEGEGESRKEVANYGWVVRNSEPIVVEVTDQDFDELHRQSKTPQAVIRRISKVRDSLAFYPTKLYNS